MGERRREQWDLSHGGQQEDQSTGHPQGEEQGEQERPGTPPGHCWEVRQGLAWLGAWETMSTDCCCSVPTFPSASQSALSRSLSLSSVQLFTFYLCNVGSLYFSYQISMKFIIIKCSQLMKTIYGTKTNLKDLMWRNKILLRTNLWKSNQIQHRLGCLVNCVKYISDHSRI